MGPSNSPSSYIHREMKTYDVHPKSCSQKSALLIVAEQSKQLGCSHGKELSSGSGYRAEQP
jgi:hypothetical protein